MEAAEENNKSSKISNKTKLYAIGAIVGLFLVYKIFYTVGNIVNGDSDIDDSISVGDLPTGTASFSLQQAKVYAQQLLDAMNAKQPIWGTDEAMILAVFEKFKTVDDFRLVYNVFGLKDYNGNNSPPTGVWSNLDSYEKRNLIYWLKSELSPSDEKVYNVVKQYVLNAGFAW